MLAVMLALLVAGCGGDEEAVPTFTPIVEEAGAESPAGAPSPIPTDLPTPVPATDTPPPTPTPPAPLAAMVNGQYIFLADYERQVLQLEQALAEQGLDLEGEEGQAYLAQMRQEVLASLIDLALIEQAAPGLGVAVSEETLEAQVEADIGAGGGEAAFEEWLRVTGQTRDDYKEALRQAMLVQGVQEAVTAGMPDAVEQVHARHIAVDSEETAREILARLREGADFAEMAREYSLDEMTKDNGGDLDWFPRDVVAPELEEAAFALQPGELSEPVPMGDGFHIILVEEREVARPLSPELRIQLQQNRLERWLEEQRLAAVIERFVGE